MNAREARRMYKASTERQKRSDDAYAITDGGETERFWADLESAYAARRFMLDNRIVLAAVHRLVRQSGVSFPVKYAEDEDQGQLDIRRQIDASINNQLVAGLQKDGFVAALRTTKDKHGAEWTDIDVRW